jgi:hypothetical protein
MSIHTVRDMETGVVVHHIGGRVKVRRLLEPILSGAAGQASRRALWDFRHTDLRDLSQERIQKLLECVGVGEGWSISGRHALLFSDLSGFDCGRMFEAMVETLPSQCQVQSFLEHRPAWLWLLLNRSARGNRGLAI